jgi:uncharacterized protein YdgA (DUF945 family)
MKKALLGILIIIAIGIIAAPFVNGLIMEKVLHSQLEKVNELYADQPFSPHFEITRYDRGFGTSDIEWTITFPQLQGLEGIKTIVLVEKAKHGYLGATSTTSLDQNSWYTDFISEKLNGKDPLTITSDYNLLNGATGTFSVESFELVDDKNNLIVVSPAELVVKTDRDFEKIATHGNFDGFSIPGEIGIEGIAFDSDMKVVSSLIMDGTSSFSIDQISIKESNKSKAVAISAIDAASTIDVDETNQKLSMSTTYSIDKIVADNEKVDDIRVRVGINQLDYDGFESVYNVYVDMLSDLMETLATTEGNSEQAAAMMEQQMPLFGLRLMSEAEKLLKKDLQIEITDLHLTLPQGEVEGDFTIGLKKDMTMMDFLPLTQQPEMLVEIFSFASNMTLPEGLVPNQNQLLAPMFPGMETGVFEMQGDKLVHKAEIKDDMLMLNGKELVLRR